jgi:hypothetical protein
MCASCPLPVDGAHCTHTKQGPHSRAGAHFNSMCAAPLTVACAALTQPSTTPVFSPEHKLANSPIIVANLKKKLEGYATINITNATELLEGFSKGFKLGYTGPRVLKKSNNLISAKENIEEVHSKINAEIIKGRVGGPYVAPPFENMRCSPIGLMPKKAPGEFRLIHHLSWPEGKSVNDHIDPDKASVKYASFDYAIIIVQKAGKNCELAKCDVKSAFRLLPIHHEDYDLVEFAFHQKYYFDKAMQFGCSVSCATWEKFSTFIERVVQTEGAFQYTIWMITCLLGLKGQETARHCWRFSTKPASTWGFQ